MAGGTWRAAVGRGARTGVVAASGFGLGHWVLASTDVAVFATFTGLALTGIADFGGTLPGRSRATALAGLAGVGLAALGTWASLEPLAVQVVVMWVTAATVTYLSVLGGYAAAGAVAVTLFYLVAAGSPAPLGHLPGRLTGVVVGGLLATVAGVVLWPAQPRRAVERTLADASDRLASRLGGPAGPSPEGPPIRGLIDALEERPSAPTRRARAGLYLLNDLERLDGLIRRLRPDDPGSAAARTAAGDLLRDCAAALRAGDAAPLAGAEAPVLHGYDPPERLRAVAGSAAAHTAALLEDRPRSAGATVDDAIRRLRAHLSLHSVHARDAVRTGFGLGAACALAGAFSLAHGFWVALATLTVLRSSLRATARRVGAAVAGTVVGSAAAFLLVEAVGSRTGLYAALLPVVVAVAIAANAGVGFLAGQAGFTVAIVVLFNLLAPAGWHIGILRVEDVAAGALTGAVAGVLAWPRGAGAELPAAVGALTRTGRAYLAASVRALAGGDADPGVSQALDRARRPAMVAAVRVDADLAQYLAEAPAPEEAAAWAAAAAAGHRLWYVADLLRTCDARPVSDPVVLMAAADRILAPDGDPRTGADRARPQSGSAPQGDPLLDWLDDLGTSSVPRPV